MHVIMCCNLIFKIAQTAGLFTTAANFLSRLELKVKEKEPLKIREDIQTIPSELTRSSSDVADEEQFFLRTSRQSRGVRGTNF